MRTFEVREGSLVWLPDLVADDLPSPLPKSLTVHVRAGTIGIEAQGVTGTIPLVGGDVLRIAPKVGDANFLRMLAVATGDRSTAREYDDFVTYGESDEKTLAAMVARRMTAAADHALRASPRPARRWRRLTSEFPAGRLDVVATQLRAEQGLSNPFVTQRKERTYDTAENRVVAHALERALAHLVGTELEWARQVLQRWKVVALPSASLGDDLVALARRPARPGGSRPYYDELLKLAQVLLGLSGLAAQGSSLAGDAALIDTARVFEEYVRCVVRGTHAALGYTVNKGRGIFLYIGNEYELEPDLVVSFDQQPVLLADAKYKRVDGADHYQMHSYLERYGVTRGVFLTIQEYATEASVVRHERAGGVIVSELMLPLGCLDTTEAALANLAADFAR